MYGGNLRGRKIIQQLHDIFLVQALGVNLTMVLVHSANNPPQPLNPPQASTGLIYQSALVSSSKPDLWSRNWFSAKPGTRQLEPEAKLPVRHAQGELSLVTRRKSVPSSLFGREHDHQPDPQILMRELICCIKRGTVQFFPFTDIW